ncbi:hypothetical protein KHA80_22880 [Anaerobacillus sp. HL2]|nr:hypothetical protein KHA80_22880 [Anaerobacillus sp. HL2]
MIPEVIVSPLDTSTDPYVVKVVTNNEEKGKLNDDFNTIISTWKYSSSG